MHANAVRVGVAVPNVWIPAISSEFFDTSLLIGAQDVSPHDHGAFTGEVSAAMLSPWCAFTLIGHSERRLHHGESDSLIRAKLDAAIDNEMAAVLCVGETLAQREVGDAFSVVAAQITGAAGHLDQERIQSLLIAYEPVWAIGTGKSATPDDAQRMAAHIRSLIAVISNDTASDVPILYGGSVNPANAAGFLAQPDVDGALVGGASLDADDFRKIVDAARIT